MTKKRKLKTNRPKPKFKSLKNWKIQTKNQHLKTKNKSDWKVRKKSPQLPKAVKMICPPIGGTKK